VDRTDQLVPSHASANVKAAPALLVKPPTAMHAFAEVHDTPLRTPRFAPVALGVDWTDQLVPSQRSASVPWWSPMGVGYSE
jgi:hypothetical protein